MPYFSSKIQALVDNVEDKMEESLTLDLSGINAKHITSRIYDFTQLTSLNISHNRIRRLPDDIQYLTRQLYKYLKLLVSKNLMY